MTNIVDQYSVVEDGLPVKLPSGAEFTVLTQSEVEYVTDRVERYGSTFRFENVSDLQDVDRIVIMELLVFRWGSDAARGKDVHGVEADDANLQKRIKELSMELRQTKASLGMDRVARAKENDESSVSAYLDRLRKRAKEFGIMREEQFDKGLELGHNLIALWQLHRNCLAGETEVLTLDGVRTIKELAGTEPVLLLGNGAWRSVPVKSFGSDLLYALDISRNRTHMTIYATANHRWFMTGNRSYAPRVKEMTTLELQPGYRLATLRGHLPGNVVMSPPGVCAGFVFGDGSRDANQFGSGSQAWLFGDKDGELAPWFAGFPQSEEESQPGRPRHLHVTNLPRLWKDRPPMRESYAYLYGWLAGYFAADGTVSTTGSASITSYDLENLIVARDVAYRLSLPTLSITSHNSLSPFNGTPVTAYRLNFPIGGLPAEFFLLSEHRRRGIRTRSSKRNRPLPDWQVDAVRITDRYEEVYCAVVPEARSFALAGNLKTGNCDEVERRQQQCETQDVIDWIGDVYKPQFEAIDEHFRSRPDGQRSWVGSL